MNKIKSYQCAVFCSVSCHVIELPIEPHFINHKMIIATFHLLLSAYLTYLRSDSHLIVERDELFVESAVRLLGGGRGGGRALDMDK